MNWMPVFKKVFRTPSAEMLAAQELENAKRELLNAQSALEYAAAMVEYHTSRIQRLKTVVSEVAR